jgi:PQQ-like domain
MKINLIGSVGSEGGVRSSVSLTSDEIGVVLGRGKTFSVIVFRFDFQRMSITEKWSYQIKNNNNNINYLWRGHSLFINDVSIVRTNDRSFYLAGGRDRKLINIDFEEIATCNSQVSYPTSPAKIFNNSLIVPEGQFISGYDLNTLSLKWKSSTPDRMWASSTPYDSFLLLTGEVDDQLKLWNFLSGEKWTILDIEFSSRELVVIQDLVVIAYESPAKKIALFNTTTGMVAWTASFTQKKNNFPESDGRLFDCVKKYQNLLIVVTANYSLDALNIEDGNRSWSVIFDFKPIAFSIKNNYAWVGGKEGNILVVDLKNGMICGKTKILIPFSTQYLGENTFMSESLMPEFLPLNPVSIIPCHLGNSAIIVGNLRTVHYLEVE